MNLWTKNLKQFYRLIWRRMALMKSSVKLNDQTPSMKIEESLKFLQYPHHKKVLMNIHLSW